MRANAGKTPWITQDAYDGSNLQVNDMFTFNSIFNYGNSMFIQPSTTNWENTKAEFDNERNELLITYSLNYEAWVKRPV